MVVYKQVRDGEWIQPIMSGWKMSCCDCGLVHKIEFRIVGDVVQIRSARDNRATGQKRKSIGGCR